MIRDALLEADKRVEMMILLGAYAGLRACEIATVHSKNWDGAELYVTGKGAKTRYVPIVHPGLRRALTSCDGFLFPGRIEGHLSAGYVTKLLSRALQGPCTGYTLRHRCATRCMPGLVIFSLSAPSWVMLARRRPNGMCASPSTPSSRPSPPQPSPIPLVVLPTEVVDAVDG